MQRPDASLMRYEPQMDGDDHGSEKMSKGISRKPANLNRIDFDQADAGPHLCSSVILDFSSGLGSSSSCAWRTWRRPSALPFGTILLSLAVELLDAEEALGEGDARQRQRRFGIGIADGGAVGLPILRHGEETPGVAAPLAIDLKIRPAHRQVRVEDLALPVVFAVVGTAPGFLVEAQCDLAVQVVLVFRGAFDQPHRPFDEHELALQRAPGEAGEAVGLVRE